MDGPIEHQNQDGRKAHSQLSAWFWKPWYAKLWWFCAVAFWLIATFAPPKVNPLSSTFGLYVMLVFHPFALFWYGLIRALWHWRAVTELRSNATSDLDDEADDLYSGDGIGFHRPSPMSYLSDPTDTRSPMNPINPAYIGRHRR